MNETNAFLMYYDNIEQFEMLTDVQIGKIMRMIMYHVNGREPDLSHCELAVRLMYSVMVRAIDRGTDRMEEVKKRRSEAAAERERKKKAPSATVCQSVAERAQTETETETKKETETETETKTKQKPVQRESEAPAGIEVFSPYLPSPPLPHGTSSGFDIPSVNEVAAYCRQRKNSIDAQRFVDYYNANGWKQGRSDITDWRAVVRVWESREQKKQPAPSLPEQTASYSVGLVAEAAMRKYRNLS